jgi:Mrp family chromosome partitioning ATPase
MCGLLFSAPLFIAEWRSQIGSPQVRLARTLRVPVLAERMLEHFSPQQRHGHALSQLSDEQMESVRMLTLRIQQSCHRPGSVILFSSLDPKVSSVPLMATVAECLAEREERVLMIDAVCPDHALLPIVNLLGHNPNATVGVKSKTSPPNESDSHPLTTPDFPGLGEYLSENCDAVGELIRPTGCPGVDLISSGQVRFAREAMASSCLTELLNTCRRNYSVILVHGPAVDRAADIQMLTARVDGVILATTRAAGKDTKARALVQDLLDLGAPIIGLVA